MHCSEAEAVLRQPAWKRFSGYLLTSLFALVFLATTANIFFPKFGISNSLKAFDVCTNLQKLNYDVIDPKNQRLVFLSGLRTLYMAIVSYAHIVFVSGIASKETHSKDEMKHLSF